MSSWSERYVAAVTEGLLRAAVPDDVAAMTAYMRHQFTYLGVKAPGQKAAFRAARVATGRPPGELDVVQAIDALWAREEREYRYAGCELAGRFAAQASPDIVGHAARWITTDPWWDTCDTLARHLSKREALKNIADSGGTYGGGTATSTPRIEPARPDRRARGRR